MSNQIIPMLENTLKAHPRGVLSLLRSKGISAEPTPDTLIKAYALLGEPFLMQLFTIASSDYDFESFRGRLLGIDGLGKTQGTGGNGTYTPTIVPVVGPPDLRNEVEKRSAWDIFKKQFDKGVTILNGVTNTANALNYNFVNTDQKQAIATEEENQALVREKRSTNILLYGGIGLLVFMFVAFIFISRR